MPSANESILSSFFNLTPFKATGSSMHPLLIKNDLIYLEKIKGKLEVNDIVLIKNRGNLLIHRIIYKKGSYCITRGDNNLLSDGKIQIRQIIGKIIKVKRDGNLFKPEDIYLLQSTLYLREIRKFIKILRKNNINHVFLKGLPIHLYYDKRHAKRLYFDCDILVDRKKLYKIDEILLKLGYKKLDTDLSPDIKKGAASYQEMSYRKIVSGFPVNFDIHYDAVFMMTQLPHLEALYPKKLLDKFTDELLNEKRNIKLNDEYFYILKPEFLIIYLALHFFHHNYRGAFRLELLHKVILQSGHDNKNIFLTVSDRIKAYRLENFVYPAFILLEKYFDTNLPGFFINSIKPISPMKMSKINKLNIFDSQPRIKGGIDRFIYLFRFSPEPIYKKMWVFFNRYVIIYILLTLRKILSYYLKALSKKH